MVIYLLQGVKSNRPHVPSIHKDGLPLDTHTPDRRGEMEKFTMKTSKVNINGATDSVAQDTAKRKDFETLKRDFESLYAIRDTATAKADYESALLELSTAIATACVNKCLDPQRKTAGQQENVSNNGINPAMLNLKRGIFHDVHLLENTRTNAELATETRVTFTKDGDEVALTETVDHDALVAYGDLIGETLSDGIDLVNVAVLALLEQARDRADNGGEWLDTPYTVTRLAQKVYIKETDSAAYREEEVAPIQEVYKAVRRAIQDSRAVQTDPRNGYTYIEDMTEDGLDTIYYRMQKWADIGGYNCNGHYTGDKVTYKDFNKVMRELNLTDRQAVIIALRMRGYGYKAIGTYLGTTWEAVRNALVKVQKKCEKIGFTPSMWLEMTGNDIDC